MTGATLPPTLSVLLSSYNNREDVRGCLDDLRAQTWRDFEIILADNDSTDGTVEMVEREDPDVILLRLGTNAGFAVANNRALAASAGRLILLINTDTRFGPNLLQVLVEAAERHPDFGLFSPRMLSMADPNRVDCLGMDFLPTLTARMIGSGRAAAAGEAPYEIFGPTGGAMLARREVLERIGLYDEAFFINNEDVDFALRAFGAEVRTLHLPAATLLHRRSPNERRAPDFFLYYIQRNMELAAYKNVPGSLWLLFGSVHAVYNLFQFARWAPRGKTGIWLRAKIDAARMARGLTRRPVSARRLLGAMAQSLFERARRLAPR